MTLKLCGFAASNYYNKIKLQLLEKGVVFEEELVWTGQAHATLIDRSPMGKVPFLQTRDGPISESMACAEYIEAVYPQNKLLPADPYAAAKVRELIIYSELHLELVARQLYPEAFFGGKVSDGTKERAHKLLVQGIAAFAELAKFAPFIAGPQFTLADCAAIVHLPVVSSASKIIYGEDLLAALPVKDYLRAMGERATVRTVNTDRKANTELMLAARPAK
ncbi:MAG: glutathione S-transferase N-terminal domain-containing protein [Rhodoferax sp.]|nr:glutathione S-transferase N-terminal domain-containing protein [Rhodoferax sp.]